MIDAPHLFGAEEVFDEEAERILSALAAVFGTPRWRVDGVRSAEWIANKWRHAAEAVAEAEALAAEYHDRIDRWLEEATRADRRTIEWATAHLTDWLRREHEADEKVKSRKLPSATIASTAGRERWEVFEEAFVAWARTNRPDLLRAIPQTVATLKQALTVKDGKAITEDGETADGVAVITGERTYTVRLT